MNTRKLPGHLQHKPKNLGYVRLNGRVIYTGRWGSKEADDEYRRLIAEWLASGGRLPNEDEAGTSSYTIVDLVADYWRHAERYYRKPDGTPTGNQANIRYALRPLVQLYGEARAEDFGPLRLKALRQHLIDQDLSRGLINTRVRIIVAVFKWASSEELLPPTVFQALSSVTGLRRGRSEARETKPVRSGHDCKNGAALS